MYKEDFSKLSDSAVAKLAFMKSNRPGYFVMSMLAGAYIGIGVLLAFTAGGLLVGQPNARIVMGLTFGVALSLVVMAGAELFTGNNLVMAAGLLDKKVSIVDTLRLWVFCWIGNLCGGFLLGLIYRMTDLSSGQVGAFIVASAAAKMTAGALPLFARGILCNFLVCLAVWSASRATSDAGKLIMIFWCLFAFITTGFEHSIANMTLFSVALLEPYDAAVTFGGFAYNLAIVTLGNIVGGVLFVAVPYHMAGERRRLFGKKSAAKKPAAVSRPASAMESAPVKKPAAATQAAPSKKPAASKKSASSKKRPAQQHPDDFYSTELAPRPAADNAAAAMKKKEVAKRPAADNTAAAMKKKEMAKRPAADNTAAAMKKKEMAKRPAADNAAAGTNKKDGARKPAGIKKPGGVKKMKKG